MSKEFSEKSRFQSKYTDQFVADAQYLVEIICEKIAARRKVSLPYRFWNTDEWKKTFFIQLNHANKLLKLYDVHTIIAALKDRRAYRIESLGAKFILEPIIKELIKKSELQKEVKEEKVDVVAAPANTRRTVIAKKNPLGEL